ncbi:MAG: cyanate transporter, partial [Methylobacteriaceae bacterium]|nr:cyanate transporter [Methylobacteriaceae bacterium]
MTASGGSGSRVLLGLCLVMTALNLRPVFSSLSAVLPEVLAGTGSGPVAASLLTTVPVVCLGLFAPVAPAFAGRFGAERLIFLLLLVLAGGTALRGVAQVEAILLGSVLAAGSIAAMNVLLPGLVKRDFADRISLMTGLFSMALCAGAALAAGITVPVARALGGSWEAALASWAIPAIVAAGLWLLCPSPRRAARLQPARTGPPLWRDPLAWQVTLFMGSQSAL